MDQYSFSEENIIMTEYPWLLGGEEIDYKKFDSIYNRLESEPSFSTIVIESAQVKIKYIYGQYNDYPYFEESFMLTADNNKSFSARELLTKIHNATAKKMKDDPHNFFEGLIYEGLENGVPVYEIAQGS